VAPAATHARRTGTWQAIASMYRVGGAQLRVCVCPRLEKLVGSARVGVPEGRMLLLQLVASTFVVTAIKRTIRNRLHCNATSCVSILPPEANRCSPRAAPLTPT
jgi:hypothetical protein